MNPTKSNGLTSPQSQPAETYKKYTNSFDFATDACSSKVETSLIARLELAGHSAHLLKVGGYVVSKYGYTHHAVDLEALEAFAARLGVTHA